MSIRPPVGAEPPRTLRHRRSRRALLATSAALVLATGALPLVATAARAPAAAQPAANQPAAPPAVTAAPATPATPARDVVVNLFEWNWRSVARECTTTLGPARYGAVQVAPPQDSVSRTETTAPTPLHPWWEVYQPVSYALTSRMGDEAQFRSMVATCRTAGVDVIADVVVNHMTGQGNRSYGGRSFTKYSYAGLYGYSDFHHAPGDCPTADGSIQDFNDIRQVTNCELVGLSDLRTGSPTVQAKLAGYLNKLIGYGVAGFRVDAAKHVPEADLRAIGALLHRTVDGRVPYVALEVPPGSPGVLSPRAYTDIASVLGFDFATDVKNAFKSYPADATGNITSLRQLDESTGLLPSNRSLTFVENHDTERNGSTLSYKDGATNTLATLFLLAQPYGRPQVYSSFTFANPDDSPPADSGGYITDAVCGPAWTCLHRTVAPMVAWHNRMGNAPKANWYDDGVNLVAFSRGTTGWVALNNHATAQTRTIRTGMAPGTYCDVLRGRRSGTTCTGPRVVVDAAGRVTGTIPGKAAVAIDTADRIG